jgi:hypothetical protein
MLPDFASVNQKIKVSNLDQLFYCASAIMTVETHRFSLFRFSELSQPSEVFFS